MKHTERERLSGGEPNFENRTLFHGDNLDFLRGMNSETVHLIATDPPFNKNKDFHAAPDSLSGGAKFKDRWGWDDVHESWVDQIHDNWPATEAVITSARQAYGDDMAAFLCWLGIRLMEMRRVLRDDGTIYLHIDRTAHAYVKALMDSIFGAKNFRNEIVWCYRGGGVPLKDFAPKHDTLLRYTKTNSYTFHRQFVEYSAASKKLIEARGGVSIDNRKRDLERGATMPDWWVDINSLQAWSPERYGYPTQKPLALYKRVIEASSNPDDVVLDPFCGCATTPIAAELLGRRWVGMDIWEGAHQAVLNRLEKQGLAVPDDAVSDTDNIRLFSLGNVTLSRQPPERSDTNEMAGPTLKLRLRQPKAEWEKLSNKMMRIILAEFQSSVDGFVDCPGCGRALEAEFTELDHNLPKADYGENFITNRVLICSPCNKIKGAQKTISGLRDENTKTSWMKDKTRAKNVLKKTKKAVQNMIDLWDTEEVQQLIETARSEANPGK